MIHAALGCESKGQAKKTITWWEVLMSCLFQLILSDILAYLAKHLPCWWKFSRPVAILRGKKKELSSIRNGDETEHKCTAAAWCGKCHVMILISSPTHCCWLGGRTIVLAFHSSTCGTCVVSRTPQSHEQPCWLTSGPAQLFKERITLSCGLIATQQIKCNSIKVN